jgi:hypothetical protein
MKKDVQRESTVSGGLTLKDVVEAGFWIEKARCTVCLDRSCTKRKYNTRRSLLCWKMLLKQGSERESRMPVWKEAVQRESTVSGGLYNAERCCWGRVLEIRKQDACLDISSTKRKHNIWRSLLCWKMLWKQGSEKRKQDACLERSCTERKYNIWRSLLCWKMLLKQGSG